MKELIVQMDNQHVRKFPPSAEQEGPLACSHKNLRVRLHALHHAEFMSKLSTKLCRKSKECPVPNVFVSDVFGTWMYRSTLFDFGT